MKKVLTVFLIMSFIIITGCNEKKETKKEKNVGGWGTVLTEKQTIMSEEILNIFNEAKENYNDKDLKVVALLAEQVVSGKNYMFLAKTNNAYKIVVVYNDLEGKSKITSVENFDYTKFTNEDIANNSKELSGGWIVNIPSKPIMLDEKIQGIFDDAVSKVTGIMYYPIAVLGKQNVSGTNYAVLCYAKPDNNTNSIYLITLYEDLNNTHEIVSQAYVDLSKYNK